VKKGRLSGQRKGNPVLRKREAPSTIGTAKKTAALRESGKNLQRQMVGGGGGWGGGGGGGEYRKMGKRSGDQRKNSPFYERAEFRKNGGGRK